MASSLAKFAPCQLVVRRTFLELVDQPDCLETARRSRAFSDSFAPSYSIADADKADRKNELNDLSDAETDVSSISSPSRSPPAAESSDVESQESVHGASAAELGSFQPYPSPLTCWVPMGVLSYRLRPQVPTQACAWQAERSETILPRPLKRTGNVKRASQKTGVLLRNIPNNYTRALLLDLLDREGFACQYDFMYLPIDAESRASKGYAYINLQDSATALRFFTIFEGYTKWAVPSRKVSGVSWSGTQGLQTYIDRYRNSSIMDTHDDYKPAIFSNGVRVDFPARSHHPR